MKDVCPNCHATGWWRSSIRLEKQRSNLYNEKFARPSKAVMAKLSAAGKLTKTTFSERIEWVYYQLWHHEGRRAPGHGDDGSRLHAPAWFLGSAKRFYKKLVPEPERLLPGVTAEVMSSDFHKWTAGLSKEKIQQQIDFHRDRYRQ